MILQDILVSALTGGAFGVGAALWLFQRMIDSRIKKGFETHKAELTQKTEVLKTELSIYAHEQNVGLSRIDVQRSDSIQSIWQELCEWIDVAHYITDQQAKLARPSHEAANYEGQKNIPESEGREERIRRYKEHIKKLDEYSSCLRKKVTSGAIFFDETNYEYVVSCGKAIREATQKFLGNEFTTQFLKRLDSKVGNFEKSDDEILKDFDQVRMNLESQTKESVNNLTRVLLKEFRKLMKAETPEL
jgi:hypothetical protein